MKTLIEGGEVTGSKYPGRGKNQKEHVLRWISILLTFGVLNLTIGCRNYFHVRTTVMPSSEKIANEKNAGKALIVHFNEKKWVLTDIQLKNQIITGKLNEYKMPPTNKPVNPERPNRYIVTPSKDQRYLLNEVHLYVADFKEVVTDQISIPVSSIVKVEVYDRDTGATVGSWVLPIVGIPLLAVIIIILTKQSCPFIYTDDGTNYQFAGEIYSGSIQKPSEREDYLRLPTYPGQNLYTIKLTNEVREIQNTNLFELLVIDHPQNTEVLIDKEGKVTTLRNPLPSLSAKSLSGKDVTELLSSKDNRYYQSSSRDEELPLNDGVIMEFPGQGSSKCAKVVIRAKNSILLDYSLGKFYDMFGSAYHGFMKKQQKLPPSEMLQWRLDQGIPLSLYVERNNKWEFVDYYNIAGPMKFKDDILSVPLNGKESNPLKIKLESGNFFWEIDYAAVDYSVDENVTLKCLQAKSAFTESQKEITKLLTSADRKYYTQPSMTNQAEIKFDLPQSTAQSRTIVLHTKGWYQVIHNPEGKPDIEKLNAFRQPGHFNQFVNEQVKAMEQLVVQP